MKYIFTFAILILAITLSTAKLCTKRATLGNGCYWGTEKFFKTDFGIKQFPGSISNGKVGFMGPQGAKANPSYREVCSGRTGHVEVYDFEFDGNLSTYENLIKHFFSFHDPTTENRQGNDQGTQYASTIFYYDDDQKEVAMKLKMELQSAIDMKKINCFQGSRVVTNIIPATVFYPAEDEHQEYLDRNPWGYCNHSYRFKSWPN